jgi:hypothetical protein
MKEKTKKWRQDHPDEYKEYGKMYREKNKDKARQYYRDNIDYFNQYHKEHDKEYREKNKEKILKQEKEYQLKNKEKIKEVKRQYHIKHRDEILEKHKIYRDAHKEERKRWLNSPSGKLSSKKSHHKRRVLLNNSEGDFSKDELQLLLDFFDNKCAYTGEPLELHYHLDHIVPISKNGTNYIWNIVPSNAMPNCSKGTRDMEEWFRKQEYFSEERLQKIYEWMNLQEKIKGENNYESRNIKEIV